MKPRRNIALGGIQLESVESRLKSTERFVSELQLKTMPYVHEAVVGGWLLRNAYRDDNLHGWWIAPDQIHEYVSMLKMIGAR